MENIRGVELETKGDDGDDAIDLAATGMSLRLDLHGKTRAESEQYILEILDSCRTRFDIQKLFIITGRGNHILPTGQRGVLFKWLPKWLKSCEFKDDILVVNPDVGCYEVLLKEKRPDVILERFLKRNILSKAFKTGTTILEAKLSKTSQDLYLLGIGNIYSNTEEGFAKGMEYLTQSAKQEYLEAINALGHLYHMGIPGKLKPNYKKGAKFLLKAEKLGYDNPGLLHDLARCYFLGQGVIQDDEKAMDYLARASDQGDADAQFTLGILYLEDGYRLEDTFKRKESFRKAYHYLSAAAKQGFHRAYRKLAIMHQEGLGMVKDIEKAFFWYKKGADSGDVFCIHNVGVGYGGSLGKNIGEPLNFIKGFEYLKRSSDIGDSDSLLEVGKCLFWGRGVSDDFEQAVTYFEKAYESGNPRSHYFCGAAAILKNESKRAIDYLEEGRSGGCENCKALLIQLEKIKWFKKTPKQQHDFVFSIINDLDHFFDKSSEYTLIFADMFFKMVLSYFPNICQRMRNYQAYHFLNELTELASQTGYGVHHTFLLVFQSYATLIDINETILGNGEEDIKIIQKQFNLGVLKNLLPSHMKEIRDFSEKIHCYIVNYSVAEEYFKQGRADKAIIFLKKSLTLFSEYEFPYILVKSSLQKIRSQIANSQSLILGGRMKDEYKAETQEDIEEKQTMAESQACKNVYRFFRAAAESPIVTSAIVGGVAVVYALYGKK